MVLHHQFTLNLVLNKEKHILLFYGRSTMIPSLLTFLKNIATLSLKYLHSPHSILNSNPISITIPPLAYMDDTVWHCEHFEDLQNILNDASSLYKINNIEVNPTKSDLLRIPPKIQKQ